MILYRIFGLCLLLTFVYSFTPSNKYLVPIDLAGPSCYNLFNFSLGNQVASTFELIANEVGPGTPFPDETVIISFAQITIFNNFYASDLSNFDVSLYSSDATGNTPTIEIFRAYKLENEGCGFTPPSWYIGNTICLITVYFPVPYPIIGPIRPFPDVNQYYLVVTFTGQINPTQTQIYQWPLLCMTEVGENYQTNNPIVALNSNKYVYRTDDSSTWQRNPTGYESGGIWYGLNGPESTPTSTQWVETGTITGQLISFSPDGSKAIGSAGIYVKIGNTWALVQPTTVFVATNPPVFLSSDGSSFACNNMTSINIYTTISPNFWSVSSTIYGSALGLDEGIGITPSAATIDGQTMVVSTTFYPLSRLPDFFVLVRNDTNYVLLQQLIGLPYDNDYYQVAISADGSTIAFLWNPGAGSTPVAILSRDTNGKYVIIEERASFELWNKIALSSDGKILVGLLYSLTTFNYIPQLHFFSLVNGQYEFKSAVTIGQIAGGFNFFSFCTSSDASVIFSSVAPQFFPNQPPDATNSIVIVQQSSQTTWSIVQTVTNPQPDIENNFGIPIFCTMDGSTLLVVAYDSNTQPPSSYETFVYTGPIPTPQVSVTPTATATASSSTSPTASASTSTTASPTLSSSATTIATSTTTATSTSTTSSTESPIPSPTSTSSSSSSSSSSVSAFSPIANTAITVTSTALSILIIALCVTLFRRYCRKRSFRFCEEDEDDEDIENENYNNINTTIENRSDPLLRVN